MVQTKEYADRQNSESRSCGRFSVLGYLQDSAFTEKITKFDNMYSGEPQTLLTIQLKRDSNGCETFHSVQASKT